MIIQIRGPWKKASKADQDIQLGTIAAGADAYKTLLDIPTDDVTRLTNSKAMQDFITNKRPKYEDFVHSLTSFDDVLRDGDMNADMPDYPLLPVPGTVPAAVKGGVWKFIENRRAVWMKHPNFDETIGQAMGILGPLISFDTDTYKPTLKVKVLPGEIDIKTDSAIIKTHNLYAAISGGEMKLVATFNGARYKYYRALTAPPAPENVDLKVRGVHDNSEIGFFSDIVTVAYKG